MLGCVSKVFTAEEVAQGSPYLPRVCPGRVEQKVKVFSGAWPSVKGDCVGAFHEMPDPMGI